MLELNMRKVLAILLISLLWTNISLAKSIKKGSGPLKLDDEAVKFFHIYLSEKITSSSFKAKNLPGMTYQTPDGKPRYANYFLIQNQKRPYIWVWWNDQAIRAEEAGTFGCENGACKQFASKNKIVWKGAKKRISRKITLDELKVVLKELGFYE